MLAGCRAYRLPLCPVPLFWLPNPLKSPDMSIWSNIAGAAQVLGSSVGDFFAGYSHKSSAPEKSIAFTIGMIALRAKMAKADGVVTRDEVAAFKQVFHVPEKDMPAVQRVFDLAKQDIAGFETYAEQVANLFVPRSSASGERHGRAVPYRQGRSRDP